MTEIETWCDWREEKERENREFLKVFAQDFKCCRPFNWRGTLMRKNTSYSKHRSYKGTHFHIRSFSSDNLSLELVFWPPPWAVMQWFRTRLGNRVRRGIWRCTSSKLSPCGDPTLWRVWKKYRQMFSCRICIAAFASSQSCCCPNRENADRLKSVFW